jgi:hypothetical protein
MSVTANLTTNVETITATIQVEEETIVAEINTAARGPAGPAGEGGNIDADTTSDGTADLDLLNVTTATATVTGTLTADHIHGNIAGSVYAHVTAGEALLKGDPVYVSGFNNGTSTAQVMKADAANASKMPAVGIMDADVAHNASGHMVITGTITGLNTNAYTVNAELYVNSGGGLTATPPSARAQPVARVERVNTNNGAIIVKVNGLSASDGTANTLVRRDASGNFSASAITATSLTSNGFTTDGQVEFNGTDAGDSLAFNMVNYTYGEGSASAHRIALGAGTTGAELFQAATVAAANATLGVVSKRKTTQTNRNNSTTYTTDSDFTIPVTAGNTYRVEFAIYTTAGAGGFKGQFTIPSVPANITISANGVGLTSQPGAAIVALAMTTGGVIGAAALTRGTSTTNGTYHGFFEVTIGTTGGNLLFQWSQASASADNTSVLANSTVTAIERSY